MPDFKYGQEEIMRISFFIILIFAILFMYLIPHTWGVNGREIYFSKCGACHKNDGQASSFAPTKYASTQWKRFFKRNKHKRKKNIDSIFTKEEITLVQDYLVKHAADSDQPEAVGLK